MIPPVRINNNDLDLRFDWALNSLEAVKDSSTKNVFDIGSGKELLRNRIISMGLTYNAFDIYPVNETVTKWNVDDTCPIGDKADVVLFMEVIEHLNNPWLGIKNISQAMNKGGHLILTTPNPSWSESRLNMFYKGVLTMFTQHDLDVNHHVFTPWKHILEKILTDNGFRITKFENLGEKTTITTKPFWGVKMPARLIYRGAKKIIERNNPDSIGPLYGVIAQKIC